METKQLLIYIPADWLAAFELEAKRQKMSLSEWLRTLGVNSLPASARAKLSEPLRRGPKKRVAR